MSYSRRCACCFLRGRAGEGENKRAERRAAAIFCIAKRSRLPNCPPNMRKGGAGTVPAPVNDGREGGIHSVGALPRVRLFGQGTGLLAEGYDIAVTGRPGWCAAGLAVMLLYGDDAWRTRRVKRVNAYRRRPLAHVRGRGVVGWGLIGLAVPSPLPIGLLSDVYARPPRAHHCVSLATLAMGTVSRWICACRQHSSFASRS